MSLLDLFLVVSDYCLNVWLHSIFVSLFYGVCTINIVMGDIADIEKKKSEIV